MPDSKDRNGAKEKSPKNSASEKLLEDIPEHGLAHHTVRRRPPCGVSLLLDSSYVHKATRRLRSGETRVIKSIFMSLIAVCFKRIDRVNKNFVNNFLS